MRSASEEEAVRHLGEHLVQELNVKSIEVVRGEGALMNYSVRPVLPRLGPRFGQRVPALRSALEALAPAVVADLVHAGQPVPLDVGGEAVELAPEDVEVSAQARPGLSTAGEGGYVVGIATVISEPLRTEGLARDVVRRVQQLRKDSGLDISDRIHLMVDAGADLTAALEAWREYVAGETLALSLVLGPLADDMTFRMTDEIEGQGATIGLRRA